MGKRSDSVKRHIAKLHKVEHVEKNLPMQYVLEMPQMKIVPKMTQVPQMTQMPQMTQVPHELELPHDEQFYMDRMRMRRQLLAEMALFEIG